MTAQAHAQTVGSYALWMLLFLLLVGPLLGCDDGASPGPQGEVSADTELDSTSDQAEQGCGGSIDNRTLRLLPSQTLLERQVMAQNTSELDAQSPIPAPTFGALRASACGEVGALFRDGPALRYQALHDGSRSPTKAAETLVEDEASEVFSLFFDEACQPTVMVPRERGFLQLQRVDDVWQATPIELDLESLGQANSHQLRAAKVAPSGRFFVLSSLRGAASPSYLIGQRTADTTGAWSWSLVPALDVSELHDFAFDDQGRLHVSYRNPRFPCDPSCDMSSTHAVFDGTQWQHSLIHEGLWGPPLDEYLAASSLELDAQGRVFMASHFVRRVETGSYQDTRLEFLALSEETCFETVADANAAYAGNDGSKFTGAEPFINVDAEGRIAVLFLDLAVWHNSSGWQNEQRGGARLARRTKQGWKSEVVFAQSGQSEAAKPLQSMGQAQFALRPDGSGGNILLVTRDWDSDSVYNDSAVEATLRVISIPLGFESE